MPARATRIETKETEGHSDSDLSGFLLYTLSLPERVVRSTVGVTAGAAREATHALVPRAFQTSKTYEVVLVNSLKFLTENVGGVEPAAAAPETGGASDRYFARKAVGSFVDFAGLATLHLSPLWMFAVVSDVAYGSRSYVHELAAELRQRGLISERSTIDRVDDLLTAIRTASSETASLFDVPPLSVKQLRLTLERTKAAIAVADPRSLLPESELRAYWNEMRAVAARENVSLLGVSGALTLHMLGKVGAVSKGALAGAEVAGGLFNRAVVGHYVEALRIVRERGFNRLIRESSAPYVKAVWRNFASERETWTNWILTGKAFRSLWQAIASRRRPETASETPE